MVVSRVGNTGTHPRSRRVDLGSFAWQGVLLTMETQGNVAKLEADGTVWSLVM